jgi:hypothetical protein
MSKPALSLSLALAALLACTTEKSTSRDESSGSEAPTDAPARPMPDAMLPWTDAFQKSAVLLANDIRIEGPQGLIARVATVSNPDELDRVEKATPEGYLVVIQAKPEVYGVEIKAQLDRLAIVALEHLTLLERPGASSVVVDARGEVFWKELETKAEKHAPALRLEGKIPR